ncbi:ARM repeat-containing protein [Gigaspora margarita]|uniref:ARM repeat-containing protein n=1 Tax=Gigaspora margarita TaxID=4874 RepID=A0A8H4ETK9_GIGMA|nr:ARM repeat-containing protein [Gigaspora margarita]
MDQAVYEVLSRVLSPDPNIRMSAELRLRDLSNVPEYPISLAKMTISQDVDISYRQSAVINLKNYVVSHWSSTSETFAGIETTEEAKAIVREVIFNGLSDPSNKIRVASAYVISKIAHNDWPDYWPDLLDLLISLLKTGSPEQVHGAMRVMTEFVTHDITEVQFSQIAPILLPELLRILRSDQVYSYRTRGRSIAIFRHCIEILFICKEEHPEATESFLMAPVIPDWLQIFINILKQHTTDNEEREFEEYGLKLEVVKCLNLIIKYFPKLLSSYLIALLEPIWLDLVHQRERFINNFIRPSSDFISTCQDSDGEVFGFEYLLFAQFEFVGLSVRKKSAKPLFVQDNGESTFLKQVVWIILSYMQMTKEQVETWLTDANQFVADDDDETFNFTVRVAAGDLLEILLEKFPEKTLQALAETTQHLIEESNIARAAGDSVWWKVQEACLKAVGFVSNELITALQDKASKVKFDLPGLFEHVVFDHLTATEYPFLQGRAFVFASQYAVMLPGELASRYVSEAVCAIQGIGAIPVKVSALRALQNFCRHLDVQYVAPFQSNIIENVANLLNIVSEDSLILVLETLEEAIKINHVVTARYENLIGPLIIDVWMKHPTDHTIYPLVTDIFEELSSNVDVHASFQARALPPLANILINNTDPAVTASAIDLIASLVKGGPSPLPSPYIEHVFPPLMHLMLTTEDRSILQNGEICLKYFVQKDCTRIAEWNDVNGKTGLDYVIQFIAKSLQPTESESATFFGDLVVKLIEKAGNRLLPVLPELLRAVAAKLESARTATFIQSLLMIFAHLTLNQKSTVINFMSESVINGKNGLDILLNTWLENHDSFQGHYNIKISAIALSELFLSCDPRIQNIKVKEIMTRSRTRQNPHQYVYISATLKIIKLLVSDLQNAAEGDNLKRSELDDILDDEEAIETDDDDDEWEDVEEPSPFAPSEDYIVLSEFNKIRELEDLEDDPDIKDSPIYHTNLREYLMDFFRHCASHNINNFAEICSALNEEEQLKLRFVITGSRT